MVKQSSQQDVADAAGVSRSAVSHYLNGRFQFLSAETQARIAGALEELDYVAPVAPMRMRGRRNPTLTLVLPFLSGMLLAAKLEAIAAELDRRGHTVQFRFHFGHADRLAEVIQACIEEQIALVVFVPGYLPVADAEAQLARALEHGIHLVLADMFDASCLPCDRVAIDRPAGARAAVEHLLELGHRAFGAVLRLETDSLEDNFRYTAIRTVLAGHSLALPADRLLSHAIPEPAYAGCRDDVAAFLARLAETDNLPTAFLGNNDEVALAIVHGLEALGLSVPRDVSVIGYNDDKVALSARPPLTTVRQPVDLLATTLADTIAQRLAHPRARPTTRTLAPELVIRESTAAPRST